MNTKNNLELKEAMQQPKSIPHFRITTLTEQFYTIFKTLQSQDTPNYIMVWYYTGNGFHLINGGEKKEIKKNRIFFFSSEQPHTITYYSNITGVAIIFSEQFLQCTEAIIVDHIKTTLYPIDNIIYCDLQPPTNFTLLKNYISIIKAEEEYHQKEFEHLYCLTSLFNVFIIQLVRNGKWNADIRLLSKDISYQTYQKFKELVENHFHQFKTVNEYARELNVSTSLLFKYTKQYSNLSPLKIINHRIITEAQHLMAHTNKNINEISNLLGFKDASSFVKFYKRNTGKTPSNFKKNMHKTSTNA